MIESKIVSLLQKQVTKAVNGLFPVKYLNTNIEVTDSFWEIVYIPNNIENEFWGKGKTYQGILRLILHWPADNTGIYTPLQEAERVAGEFSKGLELFGDDIKVIITDNPNLTSLNEDDGKLLIPLTIRYLCFKL